VLDQGSHGTCCNIPSVFSVKHINQGTLCNPKNSLKLDVSGDMLRAFTDLAKVGNET
jgi:hypothetical protein